MDELKEIETLIKKARQKELEKNSLTNQVFEILDDLKINLSESTAAENASNLEEAISCYIDYGEYSITEIIDEIKNQMN